MTEFLDGLSKNSLFCGCLGCEAYIVFTASFSVPVNWHDYLSFVCSP
jgi:hypothetical protein